MKFAPPLAAACLLLAGAGQVQAQGPARPPLFDLDHDGRVTAAEFRKVQADGLLQRFDADRDGKITAKELQTAAVRAKSMGAKDSPERATRLQARLDANRDAVISRGEIETDVGRRFKMADSNSDGWLSKGELLSMRQNRTREN